MTKHGALPMTTPETATDAAALIAEAKERAAGYLNLPDEERAAWMTAPPEECTSMLVSARLALALEASLEREALLRKALEVIVFVEEHNVWDVEDARAFIDKARAALGDAP